MRFDLHLRRDVAARLDKLAVQMAVWESKPVMSDEDKDRVRSRITSFEHTTQASNLVVPGVDGSGHFSALAYADSFVYLAKAQGTFCPQQL